uniref:Uncharacterized protein n=1 Tax=Arundo donax TaxID=35708 RepID=A0A0A9F0Y2_ARUDO
MTMVTLEWIPVVHILLELRTVFVDPQLVGVILFDFGRCAFCLSTFKSIS